MSQEGDINPKILFQNNDKAPTSGGHNPVTCLGSSAMKHEAKTPVRLYHSLASNTELQMATECHSGWERPQAKRPGFLEAMRKRGAEMWASWHSPETPAYVKTRPFSGYMHTDLCETWRAGGRAVPQSTSVTPSRSPAHSLPTSLPASCSDPAEYPGLAPHSASVPPLCP